MKKIGLFGGTFDPIHNGHLRMALELKRALGLDEMRLLPCHLPPHRERPGVGSRQRAKMAELAVANCSDLDVDCRELERDKDSYSIDTLIELRQELGDQVSLTLCMGMDSLCNLPSWHRWRELLNYSHIAVVARPGNELPREGELCNWLTDHAGSPAAINDNACGSVSVYQLSLLPVSATEIRRQIGAGESPQFLLPDSVLHYIEQQGLYSA